MNAPSRESLLESFVPGASLPTRDTMLKIYGYGVTDPEYVDTALDRLESLGCSSIRETYQSVIDDYQMEHEAMLKRVSKWYVGWCKRNEEIRKRKDGERSRKLKTFTKKEWIVLYQTLLAEGIVKDPDQFAELMIPYLLT